MSEQVIETVKPKARKPKAKASAPSTPEKTDESSTQAGYARIGVENLVKLNKLAVDLVVEQSEIAAGYVKDRYDLEGDDSPATIIDLSVDAVEKVAATQQKVTELVADRLTRRDEKVQEEVVVKEKPKRAEVRGYARAGVARMLDAQEEIIGLGQKQGNVIVDGLKDIRGGKLRNLPSTTVRLSGQAVENVLDSQAVFLDLLDSYVSDVARLSRKDKKKPEAGTVADLVTKSVDSLVRTQKRMLDVVKDQTEATVDRIVSEVDVEEAEANEWADLAREGLGVMADAQRNGIAYARKISDKLLVN